MPRYTDADWLIEEANKDGAYGYVDSYQIAKAPTADVVKVVRCKNCKNHEWCSIEDVALNDETFFCKWGKSKEDEQGK